MSSKGAGNLPAGKPSPPAGNEARQRESSLEGQQPKNDASTSISQGTAPPSAQPVEAAVTRPPNTVPSNLTSNRLDRHPLPHTTHLGRILSWGRPPERLGVTNSILDVMLGTGQAFQLMRARSAAAQQRISMS